MMRGALTDTKHLVAVVIILAIVALVVLATISFFILRMSTGVLHTNEELRMILHPNGTTQYSVWLPVLKGSPLSSPGRLALGGAAAELVQAPYGPYFNITTVGGVEITGYSSFSGALNESYHDYKWTGNYTRENPTVLARAFASGDIRVNISYHAWSDYCDRRDEIVGTLSGDGTWMSLSVNSQTICQ